MRLTSALTISFITVVIGYIFREPLLWLPISFFLSSIVDLYTRKWIMSDRLGSSVMLSLALKSFLSIISLWAGLGQFVCIGLLIWWFV